MKACIKIRMTYRVISTSRRKTRKVIRVVKFQTHVSINKYNKETSNEKDEECFFLTTGRAIINNIVSQEADKKTDREKSL